MSKYQTIRTIRSEIERLNQEIDLRIIKGVSYRGLALRHKLLRAQLNRLTPRRSGVLGRSFSSVFSYMF